MNKENVDFLKERLFFLGFGENLNAEMEKKIKEQAEKFTLSMAAEFGKDDKKQIVNYVLDFSKSKTKDMHFVNNYTAMLMHDDLEKVKSQKFYLNNGTGVTAKEAFNMLEGRAVHKNKLYNKNDEKYEAWLQLDFKEQDKHGNFKMNQYHQAWNYDLEKSLHRHPIKELENSTQKEQLINSLRKGNVQQATFIIEDKPVKMFLEANPRERNVNVFDENMKKHGQGVKKVNGQALHQGGGERGATENGKEQSAATTPENKQDSKQKKKIAEKGKAEKTSLGNGPTKTRSKKKGMSV